MLRIPGPSFHRRLFGATTISLAYIASSGLAWVSRSSRIPAIVGLPAAVVPTSRRENIFEVNLKVWAKKPTGTSEPAASPVRIHSKGPGPDSKDSQLLASQVIRAETGKVTEILFTSDAKTYFLDVVVKEIQKVAAQNPVDSIAVIVTRLTLGTITAGNKRTIIVEPQITGLDKRSVVISVSDITFDFVVTKK